MKLLVMIDPYWHRVYQSSQHEREHEGRCSIDKGPTNLSAASHSVDFSSKSRHCAQAAEETKLYAIKNSCRTLCIHLQKDQTNQRDSNTIYINRINTCFSYHTALAVTASDAMIPAARTLATSVPMGSHLRDLCLPIPWPLSLAKYQRNQTPGGATEHPNHSTAPSSRLRTFIMANTMLRTHTKESKIIITAISTKCLVLVLTFRCSQFHLLPIEIFS